MKRRAIINITYEKMEKLIGLPPEHSVIDIVCGSEDQKTDIIRVKIEGPGCPIVPEGQVVPWVMLPLIKENYERKTKE